MAVKTEGIIFLFYANLRGWKVSGFKVPGFQALTVSRSQCLRVSRFQGLITVIFGTKRVMIVWLLFKTAPPLPFLSTRCCVIKTTSHSKTLTFSLCDSDFLKWGLTFLFCRGGTFFSASSQVYAINISKLGLCTPPNTKLQRKCPPFNFKGIYCQPEPDKNTKCS